MRFIHSVAFLLACSGSALAQEEFSITFGEIEGQVTPGSVLSVDVFGDSTFGTHLLGGGFGVAATTNNFEVLDMTWTNAPWSDFNTDGGHSGGGNYDSVIFGQLITGPPGLDNPAPGSELGGRIGTFQIEVGQLGSFWSLELQLVSVAHFPFTLEVLDDPTGAILNDTQGTLSLGSARVAFIPAPAIPAVLGCLGLLASRRRR